MMDYKFLHQGFNGLIDKISSLIDIRIFGHLNLVMMSSNMKCTAVVALQSLTALALAHPVKYSVAVTMYLDPVRFPGGFIGPMKSMDHFSNSCRVSYGAKGISSLLYGFPTLWKTSHDLY
jgi:hypothetical protein